MVATPSLRKINELAYGKPGCSPVGNLGNITLHYFDIRGRAEPIRLLLEESGMNWSEISFTDETWPRHKKAGIRSGLYTFGQVPAINTSVGISLVQTHAILHFLGRAAGFDCDCEDQHICEMISLGVEDAYSKITKMLWESDWRLDDRHHYLNVILPMWFEHLEKIAPKLASMSSAFFASQRITWIDFLIFNYIDVNKEFGNYDFPGAEKVDVLANFPKLNNFYHYFSRRPRIAQYLRGSKRHSFKIAFQPKP